MDSGVVRLRGFSYPVLKDMEQNWDKCWSSQRFYATAYNVMTHLPLYWLVEIWLRASTMLQHMDTVGSTCSSSLVFITFISSLPPLSLSLALHTCQIAWSWSTAAVTQRGQRGQRTNSPLLRNLSLLLSSASVNPAAGFGFLTSSNTIYNISELFCFTTF